MRIVTPLTIRSRRTATVVLICVHGGGFNSDSGSLTESIPIANLTQTKVVSVLYRLAPEHPVPGCSRRHGRGLQGAAQELQTEEHRALRNLSRSYPHRPDNRPAKAAWPSAARSPRRLFRPGRLQPVRRLVGHVRAQRLSGHLDPPNPDTHDSEYVGSTNTKDPVLSPLFADVKGFPPDALHHQRTRPAAERDDHTASEIPRIGRRCRPRRLRSIAACLLERCQPARVPRSLPDHGRILRFAFGEIASWFYARYPAIYTASRLPYSKFMPQPCPKCDGMGMRIVRQPDGRSAAEPCDCRQELRVTALIGTGAHTSPLRALLFR